ncbi:DUF4339 domain-containing protein [Dysgonomonas reticulitermitis]
MKFFYVIINGQQQGPFSLDELKEKGIQKDTLVWSEGMSDWQPAGDASELKSLFGVMPPPVPNAPSSKPQAIPTIKRVNKPLSQPVLPDKKKKTGKTIGLVILGIVIGFIGLVIFGLYIENTNEVKFEVTYDSDLKNVIYPSLIFGLKEIEKQQNETLPFFKITLSSSLEKDMKIVIEESELNYETEIHETGVLEERNVIPIIKWKYDKLKNLIQPGYVDITFICYDESGKEIGHKDLNLEYRSINECVLAAHLEKENVPLYFLMAAYINEDSPVIDKFLSDVLQSQFYYLTSFLGYQAGEEMVILQVAAIFNTLKIKGVRYSDITTTSNSNSNVLSQHIRFSSEVLNNSQANCADGTAFLCSVLRKIGIHSLMVFEPGHVYLGYYTDKNKKNIRLLETTMIGTDANFLDATDANVNRFNSNLSKIDNEDYFDGYFMIDVDEARKIIKPIGK